MTQSQAETTKAGSTADTLPFSSNGNGNQDQVPPIITDNDVEQTFEALAVVREVYETRALQDLAKRLPFKVATENHAVLLEFVDGIFLVGMCAPGNFLHVRNVARALNVPSSKLNPRLITNQRFEILLATAYEQALQASVEEPEIEETFDDLDDPNARQESVDWNDFAQSDTARAKQVVPGDVVIGTGTGLRAEAERIILDAIKLRASDLHLEPWHDGGYITYRTDGDVYERITNIAPERVENLANAFADMAKIDGYKLSQKAIGKEISIVVKTRGGKRERMTLRFQGGPALYGREVVIRINRAIFRDFHQIGLEPNQIEEVQNALHHQIGVVLVTGGTGSGKSNTLEAMLRRLEQAHQYRKRVIQIGNPIEFPNKRRCQIPVGDDEDSWADALRDAMRRDPDIFSPGEFRDSNEAAIVFQASATGHLTLTTVHTNNIAQTFSRLDFLGIDRDKQASLIQLLVSQRLVPVLCEKCKVEHPQSREIAGRLIDVVFPNRDDVKDAIRSAEGHSPFFQAKGCPACNWRGFKGRTCIAEILHLTPDISRMLRNGSAGEDIVKYAITNYGMMTLAEAAARKLCRGLIPYEKVYDLLMSPATAAPGTETSWQTSATEPANQQATAASLDEDVIEGEYIDVEEFEVQQAAA